MKEKLREKSLKQPGLHKINEMDKPLGSLRKKAETIANILENQNFLRNPHYKEQLTSGIGIMGLIVQYSPSI